MDQASMYEFLKEPLPKWNGPLSVVEMFGGIGCQFKALRNIEEVEVNNHTLIEVDIDATIGYAAAHCDLNEQMQMYLFPSKERMVEELLPYGWWTNDKPTNIKRLKLSRLKQLYLSQKLTNNLGDVFKLSGEDIPKVDLITWSTPCQDFSLAGKLAGFEGKKGNLTKVSLELFEQLKDLGKLPKFLLFENVPNIKSKKHIVGFERMLDRLEDLGYYNVRDKNDNRYFVLNSLDFGMAQSRKRVFILSIHKDYLKDYHYQIPFKKPLNVRLRDFLQDNPDGKYNLSEKAIAKVLRSQHGKFTHINEKYCGTIIAGYHKTPRDAVYLKVPEKYYINEEYEMTKDLNLRDYDKPDGVYIDPELIDEDSDTTMMIGQDIKKGRIDQTQRIYSINGCSATVTARHTSETNKILVPEATKKGYAEAIPGDSIDLNQPNSKTRRGRVGKGVANTLTTSCNQAVVTKNYRIRKFTPLECWRLMGFDDVDFFNAQSTGTSDTQLYKQAGNGIVVNVLEAILRNLLLGVDEN